MPKWMGCRLNQSHLKAPSITTSIRVVLEDLFAFFFKCVWLRVSVYVCVFSRRCHTSFKSICFGSGLIVQLVDISCPWSMTWPYICDYQLIELLSCMWGLLTYGELSTPGFVGLHDDWTESWIAVVKDLYDEWNTPICHISVESKTFARLYLYFESNLDQPLEILRGPEDWQ